MPPYTPIPCNFHDRLLHHATLRQAVQIVYLPEGDTEEVIAEGIIEDVYTQAHAEYLRLHNGLTIRLDQLLRVGDVWMNEAPSC